MIHIKNKSSINKMMQAGFFLADIFNELQSLIVPGMSTLDIDLWVDHSLSEKGLTSKTKGYLGYQYACCVSINDEVVHGVPAIDRKIKDGDIVTVDVCAAWKGYCADMARTFLVGGSVSLQTKKMVNIAQKALDKGIEQAKLGNRLSDISVAIQAEVERYNFGVVRDFAGHGIGKQMHEDPEVPNYGLPGQGPLLQSGMTLAIEPMITLGGYEVYIDCDGWTVKTVDKSLSAHVEDTIVITDNGPQVLTR